MFKVVAGAPLVVAALFASVIACSSSSEETPTSPRKSASTGPATPYAQATQLPAPVPTAPPSSYDASVPPLADAGLRSGDGGKPAIPPANLACRDLTNCCQKIKSAIERAACIGVSSLAKPSTCAAALIGYQIVGCGHSPFSLGSPAAHDKDGNGNPDWVDPQGDEDVSLEDYCADYPADVDTCGGGVNGYDNDPCIANPSSTECLDDPFAGNPDFSDPDPSDPSDPFDPGAGDPEPFDPFDFGD